MSKIRYEKNLLEHTGAQICLPNLGTCAKVICIAIGHFRCISEDVRNIPGLFAAFECVWLLLGWTLITWGPLVYSSSSPEAGSSTPNFWSTFNVSKAKHAPPTLQIPGKTLESRGQVFALLSVGLTNPGHFKPEGQLVSEGLREGSSYPNMQKNPKDTMPYNHHIIPLSNWGGLSGLGMLRTFAWRLHVDAQAVQLPPHRIDHHLSRAPASIHGENAQWTSEKLSMEPEHQGISTILKTPRTSSWINMDHISVALAAAGPWPCLVACCSQITAPSSAICPDGLGGFTRNGLNGPRTSKDYRVA